MFQGFLGSSHDQTHDRKVRESYKEEDNDGLPKKTVKYAFEERMKIVECFAVRNPNIEGEESRFGSTWEWFMRAFRSMRQRAKSIGRRLMCYGEVKIKIKCVKSMFQQDPQCNKNCLKITFHGMVKLSNKKMYGKIKVKTQDVF